MPTCEGIIPEQTVPVRSVVQVDDDGNALKDDHGEVIKEIVTETTPSHPCDAEATVLSRSMQETENGTWKRTSDVLYCADCFVPGAMTHDDGSVSRHPAMTVSDA